LINVDNGLYYNIGAARIRQGGPLVENTTITQGNFNYLHSLSGTGVFEARNSATTGNGLLVDVTDKVGIGVASPSAKLDVASINGWDVVNSAGDFRINGTYQLRVGIAQGGGGAGDAYINSRNGTQRVFLGGGTNSQIVNVSGTLNGVQIRATGGINPASALDVNGDLALREGPAMAVATGSNALTLIGEYSHYRLTGAAGAFSINTIANGNDGQILTLINATGQVMTINNNNAANGILTGNNANMVSNGANNASVILIYNSTLARWTVIGSAGMLTGDDWHLSGNAASATDFIGTTNAQSFKFYSNNIERMRINPTDGEIIAGATASPYAGDMLDAVANATLTFALNGYSAQNGSGTWGEVLAGSATAFSAIQGVYGGSGLGAGGLGNYNGTNTGALRAGLVGVVSTPAATNAGVGVYGSNNIAAGNQHMGVYGTYNGTSFGLGVVGIAFGGGIPAGNNDIAVVGWRANNSNYSGYFNGNHVIANGTKSASVGTSKGNQLLYVNESPEVWFEDFGTAKLTNGECTVNLDPLFLETVFIDADHPMHVFIQMEDESNEVYVKKGTTSFTVKEKNGGNSNASFSWRLVAKRLHFQDHRFGCDPLWGEGDTRKYNQYATPPSQDYNEAIRRQGEEKKNWKPTPMPKGFIDYFELQKMNNQFEMQKPSSNRH
jgi:hypothetical protein